MTWKSYKINGPDGQFVGVAYVDPGRFIGGAVLLRWAGTSKVHEMSAEDWAAFTKRMVMVETDKARWKEIP